MSLELRVNSVVALCSMLCALCSTCLWAQTPVTVFPAKPKQGDTLMILVSSDNMNLTVSCTFNGETVPAHPVPGGYRALVGIASTLKPGNYLLDITIQKGSEGDGEQRHLKVYVASARFGVQKLRLSPSKNRLRFDPRVEEERKLKRAVLSRQTPQQLWDGAFWLPLRGRITTGYGLRRIVNGDPNYGTHKGLDIAAPAGTPVPAANTGIVALARPLILEGNTVILDHGHGVMTIYYHLSKLLVREGDLVSKGQIVGLVGATGLATGPHLHWGVYVNGTAVNPWRWTDRRFVEGLAFACLAAHRSDN